MTPGGTSPCRSRRPADRSVALWGVGRAYMAAAS